MSSLRVLIFENQAAGHRLQHVRVCAEALSRLGVEIVFATDRSTPVTDEFRTHITPVLDRITLDASFSTGSDGPAWRSALGRVSACLSSVRRNRPDHVYVLYADGLAQIAGAGRLLGWFPGKRSIEFEGILMRGRFAYPHDSWRDAVFTRAWLASTTLAPLDILHFLDPIPYERIRQRGGPLAARARLIPEPVEPPMTIERSEARRQLNLPQEGRILCCPGWLDQRKGVDRLLRAFASAGPMLRRDDRLLLIGHVDPSIQDELVKVDELVRRGRIIVRAGVVSDADLHRAFAAADVIAAPYPRSVGSSGIVARAAAFERMLLASDFGWVGMVTKRFRLGLTCDCRDETALARAIPQVLDGSASFQASPGARRFTQFHTQANYELHLTRRLRERLGGGGDEGIRTWDWVMQADPAVG
jgi:glycosyltransferase involved in cell wall biosynthesis